ncbi:Serine hydroxymethyltransferase, cytosolic [Mucor velutinosus]|uniref:Serine hydroxymethyltransferase, cytosolic n=1 Tax=Mucor velutinosus TaxID=708070 RepID=A0AAN7I4V9_9FUNG|nr:Serine hydroxymethyltransferase, cytosolic [Mucor velutinosus]
MYQRSHSATDVRLGWSDSLKKFKSQRYVKRIAPFRSISDSKQTYLGPQKNTLTKPSYLNANIIQKALLQMVQRHKSSKQVAAAVQQKNQEESGSNTPELSINEQEHSAVLSAPSLDSSISSYNDSEHSFDMDHIVQELLDNDNTSFYCPSKQDEYDEEEENIVDRAVAMLNSQGKSSTCPNLTSIANSSDMGYQHDDEEEVDEQEEQQRSLPPLPTKEESELAISNNSIELCSKTSMLKRQATIKMARAASRGQIHLKRAATWLGQKMLLASPQMQNFGLLVSQKYHSVTNFGGNAMLRLNSTSHFDTFPPALSMSASSAYTSAYSLSSSVDQEQQLQMQPQKARKLGFSEQVIYGTDADHFAYLRNQLDKKHSPSTKHTASAMNKRTFVAPKRIMYCRVMQIINLASTRDCDYELHVQLNHVTMASKRGVLRKVDKHASADRPYDEALVFQVEEPFSLNFVVAARHTNTVFREGLAKIGIWPLQSTATDSAASSKQKALPQLPIAGYTCLNFENKMDILDQGISRFRLNKPVDKSSNRWLNLELLIDIKVEEVLPAVVHRFPWSYTTNQCPSSSYESIDEKIISDPRELLVSQKHCQEGDYLTIYTRGMAHPTWKRYWVVMEKDQLVLHDFTFKDTKQPLSIISLSALLSVGKPSIDDCENVGIARKTGIMLQFNRASAVLSEPVRLESDEGLEGKAYVYGDSEQNTVHWRRALSAYVSSDEASSKVETHQHSQGGVDLRFLW